ncbi:MAG: tol-pal system protein YbgF [Alphaproteobacteria bacterium]|nr:tol-pal system protein YbgF [Alphaproteobacteria bacterium]
MRPFLASSLFALTLAISSAVPVAAQDYRSLEDRLSRAELALQDLQAEIYRGSGAPGDYPSAPAGAGIPVDQAKLNDIEQSLRQLTGQIEQMQFDIRQLKDWQQRFERDVQYRLLTLENGGTPPEGAAAPFGGTGAPPLTENPPASLPADPNAPQPIGPQASAPAPSGAPPVSDGTPLPQGTLGTITAPMPAGPSEALYNQGIDLLSRAQYAQALSNFEQVLAQDPQGPFAPQAKFYVADIQFVQKSYSDAARGYAEMLKAYPDSPRAPDAMLKLGLSLIQMGQKEQGCTTLGAIKVKYPNAGDTISSRASREAKRAGCG